MGVITRLFNFIANGIMRMLWGLQEWLLKDALKITPPTERANIVSGYYYNLELFPVLFAAAILIGVLSLPFARQRVTMDLFVLKIIKVLMFVTLIGAILTGAIELNNAIIDYMWPAGEYQNLQVRLNGTMEGMMGSAALTIAVAILGGLSFATYAIFFITLFLREFLVNALFILSPFIGAFLFLDFGPFKSASRMPKILIKATAYMLMAGIIAAGFAQVGIAIGGGFNEDQVNSTDTLSDLDIDTIEDLETESQLAQIDSNGGFRGLDPQVIQNTQNNVSSLSAVYETNTRSFDRGSPENFQDQGVYEQDALDGINDPGRLHRSKLTCVTGINGKITNDGVELSDGLGESMMAAAQLAEISQGTPQSTHYQYVAEWQQKIEEDPDKEFTADAVADCMRYLISQGIGDWQDHPNIERVSPVSTMLVIRQCAGGETNTADTSEFISNHRDCIRELEEKRTSDLQQWRETPRKPGPTFFWKNTLTSEHRNFAEKGWDWAVVGSVDFATFGAASSINQMFNSPNQRKVMHSFEMVGEDGSNLGGECQVGRNEVRCAQDPEFSDGFKMFMMWMMSFVSPIIIMFYSGYAAVGPGMMMMSKGMKGGGGGSAARGRSSGDGSDSSSGKLLRGGTKDGLDGSDPIGTESGSDHINADTTGQAVDSGIGPGSGPDVDADPVQSDGAGIGDIMKGAGSRANATQKEVRRQGLGGSPLSWAKSGAGHLKQNPPGSPPNSGPDRSDMSNDEILDDYDNYQEELQDVSAEDVQHAETEEGVAVNPEEQELTFHEADNNDQVDGQVGTLVGEDEDGNKKRYAYHSQEGNGEALEDGETYSMDGLVTRNGEVNIDHSDNPTQDSWEGEFNTISPGRQSDIKEIDSSDESLDPKDQQQMDASNGRNVEENLDNEVNQSEGLYGVDNAEVAEDWEGHDVSYGEIEQENSAEIIDAPEEQEPARSIDPELAQDENIDDDLKQNLQNIKSAKRNPDHHLQNGGPDEGQEKQFKNNIQSSSSAKNGGGSSNKEKNNTSDTSIKQQTQNTNANKKAVENNTEVKSQRSENQQSRMEINQTESDPTGNNSQNANDLSQNKQVDQTNNHNSTTAVDNGSDQGRGAENQGQNENDQIDSENRKSAERTEDVRSATDMNDEVDSNSDVESTKGRKDQINEETTTRGDDTSTDSNSDVESAKGRKDQINEETTTQGDTTSTDSNSDVESAGSVNDQINEGAATRGDTTSTDSNSDVESDKGQKDQINEETTTQGDDTSTGSNSDVESAGSVNDQINEAAETSDSNDPADDPQSGGGDDSQQVPPWLKDPNETNGRKDTSQDDRFDPADLGPEARQSRPDNNTDTRIDDGSTENTHTADVQDETPKKMGNEDINETTGSDSRIDPDD